eukprot:9905747-Karenia_brevis.AAC.1
MAKWLRRPEQRELRAELQALQNRDPGVSSGSAPGVEPAMLEEQDVSWAELPSATDLAANRGVASVAEPPTPNEEDASWADLRCAADKEQFVAAWVARRHQLPSRHSLDPVERAIQQWLQRTARHDFRAEMREVVAQSFNDFKEQVLEFTKSVCRQPSRHSTDDKERQLGEQVYNCFRGRRKLEPEQVEQLRACLGLGDAGDAARSLSQKRKLEVAEDVAQ